MPEIGRAVWQELARAAHDKHHEWRTPVLATADADGLPEARTVVLREVQPAHRQLLMYSDARAAKVAQLRARPQAALVMWSRALGWQLRLRLQVAVHDDGLAVTSRWATLRASPAARDYLSPLPPGAPVGDEPPSPTGAERGHFALLEAQVLAIDWLELHRSGHRRAVFVGEAPGVWINP
ncbi:MAG: pyridoxamine 5'-phosphate oxidase [Burkholderiales bacterium PBB5]|nr:MAG: pyridoxamine 5'-phosphate oxidase [Burkholderiales bacterium PBB5]